MKKLSSHTIKIIILSLLFVAVLCVSISNSNARFATLISTDGASRGAHWWFVVNYDETDITAYSGNSFTINLAETRSDNKTTLIQNDLVAPGSSGEFEITVDCSGCEVSSQYTLKLSKEYTDIEYPNIVFYTGVKGTATYNQLVLGTSEITGTINENTSNRSQQTAAVLIKWEWPVNTSVVENEFMGNEYQYVCEVRAYQIIPAGD